ncbi:biotin/lipoyl-binding protein, partial [Acinetobacter baumannii]|nr:biotin/lipoyl-binding protein [Acinetobacter baumannii]
MSTLEAQDHSMTESPKLTKMQYLKKHWVMVIAFIIVLVSILWILKVIFLPSSIVKTDDARVDVEYSTIAPKVSGNIEEIYIKDHQTVKKGQLLARIDARDYQAALAEAESNYAKAQADLNEAMLAVERQPTVIRETEAQLRKVEAGIKLTKDNTARYEQLQALGAESRLITQQSKTT